MVVSAFKSFVSDESGATAIEYGLIAALISLAMIAALGPAGTALKGMFDAVQQQLTNAEAGVQ